jgi:hypothetical protein
LSHESTGEPIAEQTPLFSAVIMMSYVDFFQTFDRLIEREVLSYLGGLQRKAIRVFSCPNHGSLAGKAV